MPIQNPADWNTLLNKPGTYTSSDQTITLAGALTLAHGLGAKPASVEVWLKCTSAELGYSVGDETPYFSEAGAGTNRGFCVVVADATNLNVRFASSGPQLPRKDTGAQADITVGNWKAIYKAWEE